MAVLLMALLFGSCTSPTSPSPSPTVKSTKDALSETQVNITKDVYVGTSSATSLHKLERNQLSAYGKILSIESSDSFWKDRKVYQIQVLSYENLVLYRDSIWRDEAYDSVILVDLYKEENSMEVSAEVKAQLISSTAYLESNATATITMTSTTTTGSIKGSNYMISYESLADDYDLDNYRYQKAIVAETAVLYCYVHCVNPLIGGGWDTVKIEYELVCTGSITTEYIYQAKNLTLTYSLTCGNRIRPT
jgi:hypothetical protein